jgi:single-stranded-DNA-specific exonuclease
MGIDVIACDHHAPREDGVLPDCIILNPLLRGSQYPFTGLSAAGLTLKLVQAVAERRGFDPGLVLDRLVGFAAIGTVADGAVMQDENRAIVDLGCRALMFTRRPGVLDLLRIAGITDINASTLAFSIGPRINALSREVGPAAAFRLLVERDPAASQRYAALVADALEERQTQRAQALAVAREMASERLDDSVLVLVRKDWPFGAMGAVAQALHQETGKPAFIINSRADGMLTGSCRGTDVLPALEACAAHLQRYGGHRDAAGFTLWGGRLGAFADAVNECVARAGVQALRLEIDAVVGDATEISGTTYQGLMSLGPFGNANPEPILAAHDLPIVGVRNFGEGGRHLELRLDRAEDSAGPLRSIWWGAGRRISSLLPGTRVDAAFRLRSDEHDGHAALCLYVEDVACA